LKRRTRFIKKGKTVRAAVHQKKKGKREKEGRKKAERKRKKRKKGKGSSLTSSFSSRGEKRK